MPERAPHDKDDWHGKLVVGPRTEKGKEECYHCGGRGHFAIVCPMREHKPVLLCKEEGEIIAPDHQHETQKEVDE